MFDKDVLLNNLVHLRNGGSTQLKFLIMAYLLYYGVSWLINSMFINITVKKQSTTYDYLRNVVNDKYKKTATNAKLNRQDIMEDDIEIDYLDNNIRWVKYKNTFIIIDTIHLFDKIFANPFKTTTSDDYVMVRVFRLPIFRKTTHQVVSEINHVANNRITSEQNRNTDKAKNVKIFTFDSVWLKTNNFITNTDVFTPTQQALKENVFSFYKNKHLYRKCGRPYNKVIVISGPPGTGKSSAVRLIASVTSRNIYSMDISTLNNKTFSNAITTVPPNNIILLDEFHMSSIKPVNEEQTESLLQRYGEYSHGVTIDNFLNFIDGNTTPMDTIICVVSNNYNALLTNFSDNETYNKALTRRFATHYHFDYFSVEEAMEFVNIYIEKYRDLTFSKKDLEDIEKNIHDMKRNVDNALSLSYVTDLIFKQIYSRAGGCDMLWREDKCSRNHR